MKKPAKNFGGKPGSKPVGKPMGTAGKSGSKPAGKPVREEKSVMALFPEKVTAAQLSEALDFIPGDRVEVWTDINLLELTLSTETLVFEDLTEDLRKADLEQLNEMGYAQLFACDYLGADSAEVRKIMKCLQEKFACKYGSDSEDFTPFYTPEEL